MSSLIGPRGLIASACLFLVGCEQILGLGDPPRESPAVVTAPKPTAPEPTAPGKATPAGTFIAEADTPETPAEVETPAAVPEPIKKPQSAEEPAPIETAESSETPPTTAALPEEPELPPFEPESFVGLSQQAVWQILGEPLSERQKGQATVWNYRDDYCDFALFFYLDLNTDSQRALTYELELDDQSADARNACLGALRAARRPNGSS